ncbi:glycosyl hydrolase family 8 [Alteromonas gracilis]|uniref:glycosyl hydrolase family 8 n=1 Tax=Alteromonas gracilis TaxID=1479524 RepID=UPI003736E9E8
MVTFLKAVKSTLLIGLTLLLVSCSTKEDSAFRAQFIAYKALFIDGGRVVDTGNDDVSHSEGQGYGMLFAVAADDQATFDALWRWTKHTLMRDDGLFSWRYRPCADNSASCIDDPNNASDGEILIAWALLRASKKWGVSAYQQDASDIVRAVEQKLLVEHNNHVLLLPGEYGFTSEQEGKVSMQLNLSYWVFPAITELSTISASPLRWAKLHETGLTLLSNMQFSSYRLPSDWVRFKTTKMQRNDNQALGELTLNNVLSPEFGFNAIRIPLQLAWSQKAREDNALTDKLLAPFYAWWALTPTPATVNLQTEQTAEYPMTKGMQSVELAVNSIMKSKTPVWPEINRNMDYYSASLTLLSMLAVSDNAS